MSSKKQSQKTHASRRAYERYGLRLSDNDFEDIKRLIQGGSATIVQKQSLRVSVFDLDFKETKVRVVYDKDRKQVVSFLDLTMDPDKFVGRAV